MITTSNIVLALAAVGLPLVSIGSERSYPAFSPIGFFWNTLRKYSYGLLDAVTAMSSEGKVWLESNTYAKTVVVIPNPAIWPLPVNQPYLPPIDSSRFKLLTVGRLVRVKGFDLLIDAFARVAEKLAEWDLYIVGEGPLRDELEDKIRRHNLSGRVFLPGKAGNVGDWYASADLYVLSSRVEGFPNSLVEAMSCGLPAVSFDCNTGPRDIISHNSNGLLVAAENVAELSNALGTLMEDELLRTQFSEQTAIVKDKFSIDKISGMWRGLFNRNSTIFSNQYE